MKAFILIACIAIPGLLSARDVPPEHEIIGRDTVHVNDILRLNRDTTMMVYYDTNYRYQIRKTIRVSASYLIGTRVRGTFHKHYEHETMKGFDENNILKSHPLENARPFLALPKD